MAEFSVIMPVYNAEKYLPAAIESVLNQSFRDLELILVDDGSKDTSGAICDRYAAMDGRVHAFHGQNGGICAARNRGLRKATGKWIAFIDNDDLYEPDLLETVHACTEKSGAQVVKFGYRAHETFRDGGESFRRTAPEKEMTLCREDFRAEYRRVLESGFFNMVWNGVYSRKFLDESGLHFNEEIRFGYEDWIFNYALYSAAEEIEFLPYVGYQHEQRCGVSTSKKYYDSRPHNVVIAAQTDRAMFDALGLDEAYPHAWSTRLAEYIIEVLMLFHTEGCDLNLRERAALLDEMAAREPFCTAAATPEGLPRTKRMVLKLFYSGKTRLLALAGAAYAGVVDSKKKHAKRS